jgi:GDPmannose 4,6-dehydratase
MFGNSKQKIINEKTPFAPVSPYGISKLASHNLINNYRQAFGIKCVSGILFNHESPLRGLNFVTRKVTNCFAKLKLGKIKYFNLGNLHAKRDWGYAKDYVHAAYLMLTDNMIKDYVIATGKNYSIRHLVELTAKIAGINIEYVSDSKNNKEYFINKKNSKSIINSNSANARKVELHYLKGDMSKFKKIFNWKHSINFKQLITNMYQSDYDREKKN